MSTSSHRAFVQSCFVLFALAGACGGGESAAPVVPTVSAVTVSPSTASLVVGASTTLAATITLSDGRTDTQRAPVWTSTANSVATVAGDGRVVAVGPGTASIVATSEGKSGTAVMTVLSVASVTVTPTVASILEGDSLTVAAAVVLSDGSAGSPIASWGSSAPAVASVSSVGRVVAIAAGSATITGTVGGVRGTAAVSVGKRVATVALNVAARAMIVGESLTLTPTLRFADSSIATSPSVVFASSVPAVATVSSTGVVTAITAGTTSVTATVHGRIASAAITVRGPAQTTLVASAAVTQSIGPSGGTMSTTASGVTYRLDIPAGALPAATAIRMTPVSSIANLPLSGGLVAAVDLEPSGLTFARAARLRIGIAAPPRPGFALAGFSIASADKRTGWEFATASANEVVVLVEHFSSLGVGFGTTQEVSAMPPTGARLAAAIPFVDDFVRIAQSAPPLNGPLLLAALISWFDVGVLPQLANASTDASLIAALFEFEMWSSDVFQVFAGLPVNANDPSLVSRRTQWKQQVIPKLQAAITQNNQVCESLQSIPAMLNALFWQSSAEQLGVATGSLSRSTVLQGLCAKVIISSVTFPDPVQSGFPNDLDMVVGLKFGTNPALLPVSASVTFVGTGVAFAKPSPANTNQNGQFTVAVTANGNASFSISLTPCLVLANATDVCAVQTINSNALDLSGQYTGRFSSLIRTATGVSIPTNVPVNVTLIQSQNAIRGTYEVMQFNSLRGTVSATLVGTQLLNFTLTQSAPCTGAFTGVSVATTSTRRLQSTYSGSDCSGTHSNGVSDLLPGTLSVKDVAGSWTEGFRSDGQPVNVWRMEQTGLDVRLSYAQLDLTTNVYVCLSRFRGTVLSGGNLVRATLTERIGTQARDPDFSVGTIFTWQPAASTPRAALVTPSFLGQSVVTLLINPPGSCVP